MTVPILNELQELVVSICDSLYAKHQLITKNSVRDSVLLHGTWDLDVLDKQLPIYINAWRLDNLQDSQVTTTTNNISITEENLRKYKTTIQQLRAELRGMLNG